ncbi:unnamed protein product [Effrenium voratum]|nr:unnamed protein product [Effrenium voratum]
MSPALLALLPLAAGRCFDARVGPAPRSPLETQLRWEVENLMNRVYDWRLSGYVIGSAEDEVVKAAQKRVAQNESLQAHTYGEVTPIGVRQMAEALGLRQLGPEVSFVDLGAGVGKMVLQLYLEFPRVTRALGVELHPVRAKRGKEAFSQMKALKDLQGLRRDGLLSALLPRCAEAPLAASQLKIGAANAHVEEADMLEVDLGDATHVFLASLTWGVTLTKLLCQRLLEAPRLVSVAALSRLELPGFREEDTHRFQTSWTARSVDGSRLFLYFRENISGPP